MLSCKRNESYNKLVVTKQDSINQQKIINRAFINIAAIEKIIQSGDLITRTGNDFTSESLRKLNQRNQTYSHCGIASIENDSVFVYHALGGEWNPDEKLRRDPLVLFAEPYSNKGIGIFNVDLSSSEREYLLKTARQYYARGLMFDMDFDLKTNDRMYCAEFVYKTFLQATRNKMVFNKSHIGDFSFIGVDDLFLHPLCRIKKQIVYN